MGSRCLLRHKEDDYYDETAQEGDGENKGKERIRRPRILLVPS